MKLKFLALVLALSVSASFAQNKNSKSKGKSISTPKSWGIGLRLGDPTGVTAKKYLANGNALEFNLGRSSYWGYDYSDYFHHKKYDNYHYVGYDRRGAMSLQAHYLFQKDFPNAKGLQWYLGVGPQLRFNSYSYTYRYDSGNYWTYVTEKTTEVDFGADGIIGLEYTFPNAPLSVFGDFNLLLEIMDDPGRIFAQAGTGIRYNF